MTILRTTPEDEATGLVAKIYDDDIKSLGYVTTQTKAMAINPEAYEAFEALLGTVTSAMTEPELMEIARDFRHAGLTPAEVAMMAYAEKLSGNAAAMTAQDALALRNHGFSDAEIMDITLVAAARNYLSRTLLALGVELDRPPSLSANLQEALLSRLRPTG